MVKGWKLPEEIRSQVLSEVRPTEEELRILSEVTNDLLSTIEKAIDELGYRDIEPVMAGSIAKGTVSGKPDLDVFLIFPREASDSELKEAGLSIGMKVLAEPEKRYTQHPYITGRFRGSTADIVPCRRIVRGEPVTTAVDRTPYHTEYVTERLNERSREDVMVLKSFLKGIGAYGAEDTVNGFSGYLCELMTLYFGGFPEVVEAFASLKVRRAPPGEMERISERSFMEERMGPLLFEREDLLCERPGGRKEYLEKFEKDLLIVVDPVDPERNVGAPVSGQILAHTSVMCRKLMEEPSPSFFSPFGSRPIQHHGNRSSKERFEAYYLELPEDNPDMVMTQARSFLRRSIRNMEREGEWKVWSDLLLVFPRGMEIDKAYRRGRYVHSADIDGPLLVFTLRSDPEVLPREAIHWGPPADNRRAPDFRDKWQERTRCDPKTGRLYVNVQRDRVERKDFFFSNWERLKLGPSFKGAFPGPVENQLIHEVIREASED